MVWLMSCLTPLTLESLTPIMPGMSPRKNTLADLEIDVAAKLREKRRKRVRYAAGTKTRIASEVRAGRKRPPPSPKNKTISEIDEMDPHDPQFRLPQGRPRKYIATNGEPILDNGELSWKDEIRRDRQTKANDRRARVRKHEAKVVAAVRTMEKHVTKGQQDKMEIYDEDKLIAEGELNLDDWDTEELVRGYRRNRSGKFGKPPQYISREVQQFAFRVLVNRGERKMKEAYYQTIETLVDLAHGADSEKVRLEAVKELMNRVVGKVPDRMLVAREEPWEGLLADSVVPLGEVPPLEMEMDEDGIVRLPYVDPDPKPGNGG